MDIPTRLDLYALGRDYVTQRAKRIDPNTVDTEGSDVNIVVGSQSVMSEAVARQLAYQTGRMFLDGCYGEDLDRWAYDRYRLLRKGAAAAVGAVRFFRANTGAGAGSVPIGTKVVTKSGFEYTTTAVASFAGGDLQTQSPVNVRAAIAGKGAQVGANMIARIAQPALLWDPSLQVTNDLPTAGGEEVEDDDTFKARIRDFWNVARRGVLAAIEFGAKTVPGIVSAQAVEVLTPNGLPARIVQLYIADSSGVASAALGAQVQAALLDYRAGGIPVVVNTSLPLIVSISLKLSFQAGVDTVAVSQLVQAGVFGFVNSLAVNAPLLIADLYSVLKRFAQDGLIVPQGSIVSPAGDLVPAPGQTIRTNLQNIALL